MVRSGALAACFLVCGPALAQNPSGPPANQSTEPATCDATSTAARSVVFDGEAPFAGASIHEAMSLNCSSILLYRLMPGHLPRRMSAEERRHPLPDNRPVTGTPVFFARIQTTQGYRAAESPALWADQRTCPALLPAVEALERALAPKLTGEGPVRDGQLYTMLDGATVEVWAAGLVYPLNNHSHSFETTYRTNVGTPTADWLKATLIALRPCLSPDRPTPDAAIQ